MGLDGSGPGTGWRERVTFFRVLGSEWVGFGRGCTAGGVRWGVRGKSGKQYGEREAMAVGSESARGGRLFARETVLGAPGNLK